MNQIFPCIFEHGLGTIGLTTIGPIPIGPMRFGLKPPRIKLKRKYIEHEQRILTVFNEKDNNDVLDYLRALAHNSKF